MEFKRIQPKRHPINLTPIIDIVFLLIVFFMLSSNFALTESIGVVLPSQGSKTIDSKDIVRINIIGGDSVQIDGNDIALASLHKYLAPYLSQNADIPIVLKVFSHVSVQEMVWVMDEVRFAGGKTISMQNSQGNILQ